MSSKRVSSCEDIRVLCVFEHRPICARNLDSKAAEHSGQIATLGMPSADIYSPPRASLGETSFIPLPLTIDGRLLFLR